jgi:hypothetical protein
MFMMIGALSERKKDRKKSRPHRKKRRRKENFKNPRSTARMKRTAQMMETITIAPRVVTLKMRMPTVIINNVKNKPLMMSSSNNNVL